MNTWYFLFYLLACISFVVGTVLGFSTKPSNRLAVGFIALGLAFATFVRVVQLFP